MGASYSLGKYVEPDLDETDISIDTVSNWDSLNHLRLMMSVEENFNIELSPDDFQNLTSFDELQSFINSKSNN